MGQPLLVHSTRGETNKTCLNKEKTNAQNFPLTSTCAVTAAPILFLSLSLSLLSSSLLIHMHTPHTNLSLYIQKAEGRRNGWAISKLTTLKRPNFRSQHTHQGSQESITPGGSKASSLQGHMHSHAQTYKRVIKNSKNKFWDWGDGSAWAALQKTQVIFSALTWRPTQLCYFTVVSEDEMTSFGLCRCQACLWYKDILAGKTFIYVK